MSNFAVSSDQEKGFRIPWYAAVPAVGSLGLAAFSLSRLPQTRRLIRNAKYYQENLPSLNAKIRQMEVAKNRVDQMAEAVRNIQKLEQAGEVNTAATPFYKKFLSLGGKIQEVPIDGGGVQVEAWVPGKGGMTYDPEWLAQKAARDVADTLAKRQRFLDRIAEAKAAKAVFNAGMTGSAVLGIPATVGMLYGNRENWRNDKASSLSDYLFLNMVADKNAAVKTLQEQAKQDRNDIDTLRSAASKDLGGYGPTTSMGMSSKYEGSWNPARESSNIKTVIKDNPRWHETEQNFGHPDYMTSKPHAPQSVYSNANKALYDLENPGDSDKSKGDLSKKFSEAAGSVASLLGGINRLR